MSIAFLYLSWFFHAHSNFYAGAGFAVSKNSYSTSSSISNGGALANSSSLIQASGNNAALYAAMQNNISSGNFLANGITLQDITIDITGVPVFNGGATSQDVVQSLGTAYLDSMVQNNVITISSSATQAELDALSLAVGQIIVQSAFGTTTPTAQDFANGGIAPNGGIIFQTLPPCGDLTQCAIQIQVPTATAQEYQDFVAAFGDINQQILGVFAQFGILFPDSIPTSADSSSIGVSLSVGYLAQYKKIFYGVEGVLDFDFTNKIGNNSNNEIEVKYDFTISTVGKVGISLVKNSMNYLTLGFAFREYRTNYFGITESKFTPHILLGTGMEVALTKQVNVFGEFAYITSLSKVDTGVDGRELNIKSQKLTVGARYYFDKNPIADKSPVNPSKMAQRQETAKTMNSAFKVEQKPKPAKVEPIKPKPVIKPDPIKKSGSSINFIDETKQLSAEEVRVQEIRVEKRREIRAENEKKKSVSNKQQKKK